MTHAEALAIYRAANPKARRTGSVAIVHYGGIQTILGCVCGAEHTTATRHRGKTKHERDWRALHADCIVRAAEQLRSEAVGASL